MDKPVLRCAALGMLLTALCLLPFLQKAFTIDDPFYLAQAHQALRTPLTPAATEMCWDNIGFARSIRGIGPPGLAMSYILIPVALLNDKEWVGHLIELLLVCLAVIETVALAFRCGVGETEAMLAGAFFASFPAVLVMAGTLMPDLLAGTLGVIGLERLLAWKVDGRIGQAVAAGIALGLAPLARSHTMLLLPIGIVMLAGQAERVSVASWLRAVRDTKWIRWLPIVIAIVCFVVVNRITSDGMSTSSALFPAGPNEEQVGLRFVVANLLQFGLNWMLVTPFAAAWLLLDGATGVAYVAAALIGGALLKYTMPDTPELLAVAGMAGLAAIGSAVIWACRRRRVAFAGLAMCLLLATPMIVYYHLPTKYLVPCAPAASILLAVRLFESTRAVKAWSVAIVCVGVVVGLTLLRADAAFSGLARRAVSEAVAPQIRSGHRVWYSGQWALTWYAEQAGATCLSIYPPFPEAGDIVIAGELEGGVDMVSHIPRKLRLLDKIQVTEPGIRIMNAGVRVGFYSNMTGYLPARWSSKPVNTYFVWQVE
jgi:hypothetical protein